MLKITFARLVGATAVCCACALSTAPSALAQDKMMSDKMAPKMGDKMSGGKMMSDKMVCQMCKMSASESKTYMGMSKAEKALFMKHMDKMGMGHGKMMGGKMSGKM